MLNAEAFPKIQAPMVAVPNISGETKTSCLPSPKLSFLTYRECDEAQIIWKHFVNVKVLSIS